MSDVRAASDGYRQGVDTYAERIALFPVVRNVPHATDGAHAAEALMTLIAHQRQHCPVLAAVPLLDTVRLARVLYLELPSHRLDDLVRYLRIEQPVRRHRAMPDVQVTARVFERLVVEGGRGGRWRTLMDLDRVGGLAPKRLASSKGVQVGLF